jgi:hypothetical protein
VRECAKNHEDHSMVVEKVISIIGVSPTKISKVETGDPVLLARTVLGLMFEIKKISGWPPQDLVQNFIDEFLEEIPPGNLIIPFSIIESWQIRLTSQMVNQFNSPEPISQ